MKEKLNELLKALVFFPRVPFLLLIKAYQNTISPDHGPIKAFFPNGYCKFYPTCSQYGYDVIKKRGLVIGVPLSFWRVLRCNPWSKGGVDQA